MFFLVKAQALLSVKVLNYPGFMYKELQIGVLFSIQALLAIFSKQVVIKMPLLPFCCAVFVSEILLKGKAPPNMRWRRSKTNKRLFSLSFS